MRRGRSQGAVVNAIISCSMCLRIRHYRERRVRHLNVLSFSKHDASGYSNLIVMITILYLFILYQRITYCGHIQNIKVVSAEL